MDSVSSYNANTALYDYAQKRQEMFAKIDEDGDGAISLEEFEAAKPEDAPVDGPSSSDIFAELDADGDGSLSEEEMSKMPPPPPPPPGMGMMDEDMLSALLEALSSSETDETETTTSSSESNEDEDDGFSASEREELIELIQEELENFRSQAFSTASGAYSDASGLASVFATQQQTLASI